MLDYTICPQVALFYNKNHCNSKTLNRECNFLASVVKGSHRQLANYHDQFTSPTTYVLNSNSLFISNTGLDFKQEDPNYFKYVQNTRGEINIILKLEKAPLKVKC